MKKFACTLCALAGIASAASAVPTLTALTSFGVNGWRSVGTIQAGDSAGSNNGTVYNYLGTGNTERGMAYNAATNNLILVSRSSAGNGIRRISGTTGDDLGAVAQGTGIISGGTFSMNKVGVTRDGQIFVSNLSSVNGTGASFKVYRWGSEADAAPTVYFNNNLGAPAARYGDSLDVTGLGATATIVAGANSTSGGGSTTTPSGYTIISGSGVFNTVNTFSPTLTGTRFRLGITFGKTDSDVWGKVSSDNLYRTSYGSTSAGTYNGTVSGLTSAGECNMDFVTIGGRDYLAVLDALSGGGTSGSRVYVYDVTDPANAVSLFSFGVWNSGTSTLAANANGTGSVCWGAIDQGAQSATLYTMNSNQGIQAFTFTVPAPGAASLLGLGAVAAFRRRR